MGKLIDLTGQRFGLLTVIGRSEKKSSAGAIWNCQCECGGTASANTLKLRSGHTTSCGCHRRKILSRVTHGMANSSGTYKSWKEMRNRCNNKNAHNFKWYGGRGISVCERWNDYEAFLADMGERPEGTSIDRINSDGNYEPSNCRWATASEQATSNRGVIRKGNIPINKISDEIIAEMIRLKESGMTYMEISRLLHIHHTTVSAKVRAART